MNFQKYLFGSQAISLIYSSSQNSEPLTRFLNTESLLQRKQFKMTKNKYYKTKPNQTKPSHPIESVVYLFFVKLVKMKHDFNKILLKTRRFKQRSLNLLIYHFFSFKANGMESNREKKKEKKEKNCVRISSFGHLSVWDDIPTVSFWRVDGCAIERSAISSI